MLADLGLPLLRRLPPETAHRLTLTALRWGLAGTDPLPDPPALAVSAFGLQFPNPLGLAAGFDKDAEVPDAVAALGLGFVEVGTLTPRPQAGNPRPRIFRLVEDAALINRLGFNNGGVAAAAARLTARAARGPAGILGINIGANKDTQDRIADYLAAFRQLVPFASYVTVNVSSPNTPGLRGLQDRAALTDLLGRLMEQRRIEGRPVPLLLKIAPDLDPPARADVADVARLSGLDGLIVSNTTISRPPGLRAPDRGQAGGLSGAPLAPLATEVLRDMYRLTGGRLPLVGVGGIGSGADAYARIRAGATLLQLYTALVFQGPGLIGRIKRDLAAHLSRDGFTNVTQAIGADASAP